MGFAGRAQKASSSTRRHPLLSGRDLKRPWNAGRSGASSDVECVDVGGAAFSSAVTFECLIPFRAASALDWHKPYRHLRGFLGPGIEFGDQLTRIEEEARNDKPTGVDHDEVTRRFSMRRLNMRTR